MYEVYKGVKFLEIVCRMVVSRDWRKGEMGSRVVSIDFQFCKMKNSRDVLYSIVNIFNTTQLYASNG